MLYRDHPYEPEPEALTWQLWGCAILVLLTVLLVIIGGVWLAVTYWELS